MRKYDLIKGNTELIRSFIDDEKQNDIISFLRFEGNNIIEDYSSAKALLLRPTFDQRQLANLIFVCMKVEDVLENNRKHEKGFVKDPWAEFEKIYSKVDRLSFVTEELFTKFYDTINRIKLEKDKTLVIDKNIKKLMELLEKFSADKQWQLKMFNYFVNDVYKLHQSLFYNLEKNPIESFTPKSISNKINSIFSALVDPKLFVFDIGMLFEYDPECNDYFLENKKIYYDFTSKLKDHSKEILVFQSSSWFLKKWNNDSYMNHFKVTFVIENKNLCSIYNATLNQKFHFITTSEVENYIHEHQNLIGDVLLFLNKAKTNQIGKDIIQMCLNEYVSTNVYAFGSDDLLYEIYQAHKDSDDFCLDSVSLFPPEVNYGTLPKRKSLIKFSLFPEEKASSFLIRQYKIITDKQTQYLERKPLVIEVDGTDENQKFRSLYRSAERTFSKKSANLRNQSQEIYFSEEISIRYTLTDNADMTKRINAYILDPTNHKTKLLQTKKSVRSIYESDVEHWLLKVYPYEIIKQKCGSYDIRQEIIKAFNMDNDRISLKSLKYFHPEFDGIFEGNEELFDNVLDSYLGTLSVQDITEDVIDDEIQRLYEGYEGIQRSVAFKNVLSEFFDLLVGKKFIKRNPIKQVVLRISNENKAYVQVRNALVKRHFDKEHLVGIYQSALQLYKKGDCRGLAIIMKLMTGLETNVICALQWKDIKKITAFERKEFYQIIVRKKATFDGFAFTKLGKKEKYRYVPICEELEKLLNAERERQMEVYGIPNFETLAERAIIDGGKHVVNGSVAIYSPSQTNETIRKVLRKFLTKNEISLPTSAEEEKKMDLNDYLGDIFRSNYRHYAYLEAAFEKSEVDYLLGTKQDITFSRNYCDYSNDASQLFLKTKQERFARIFQKAEPEFCELARILEDSYMTQYDKQNRTNLNIVVQSFEDTELEIENELGFDLKVICLVRK